jgi:undecaprenyl-phosphate galactose phosphotransferase
LRGNYDTFRQKFFVSITLALSDLVSFVCSIYLAIGLFLTTDINEGAARVEQLDGWIMLHWLLAFCCIGWYSVRLRHYFYRKTFWFELKEILRTLLIFAIIEIAVVAFTEWSFSRFLWGMTWLFVIILVPVCRMLTKRILANFGLWCRDTWIIGDGPNAREAYKAICSEKNLGLVVVGFISNSSEMPNERHFDGVRIIPGTDNWLSTMDKKTQFIVAVESHQGDIRNTWLRNFMIKGYRYVSVIPTLRGMPLDSTDMSFIFSHEVMIFRVQQNLAKLSSRILKRIFDIFGSLAIIIMLSPILFYISRKVKKDGGPAIYGHERIGKGGSLLSV